MRAKERARRLLALRAQLNKAIAETHSLCIAHAEAHAAQKAKRTAAAEAVTKTNNFGILCLKNLLNGK